MEFSEYDGPESPELEQAWPSLSEGQQAQIQALAQEVFPMFAITVMMGDRVGAEQIMAEVVSEAHKLAGITTA